MSGRYTDDEAPARATSLPMELDTAALKALSHPLRVRMYDLLADDGPATASQLAQDVGESSGTTSYHLRVLAEHGFIEEDVERGDRRDRWWRVRPGGYHLAAQRFVDDPAASAALDVAAGQLWRNAARQLATWYGAAEAWGPEWMRASTSTTMRFEGTQEELARLRDDVLAVLGRHRDALADRTSPPGAVRLVTQFHAFPLGLPDQPGAGERGHDEAVGDGTAGRGDPARSAPIEVGDADV